MTATSTLQLRSIFDLLKDKFFVPSYQRGYRWTARQVEALLDDLAAFQIERRLQEDAYWFFLQNKGSALPTRIEYLFDVFIRMKREPTADGLANDPLATFLAFQALLDAKPDEVWPLWQEFKTLTQTLEDWYEERVLYHLVGFLVATVTSDKTADARSRQAEARVLFDLLLERRKSTATAFDRHLRRLAWRRFAGPRAAELPADGLTAP